MRFSQVEIERRTKETTVKRKNIITKCIEFRNGLDGLTSCFAFIDGIVSVMTLIVPECPNGNHRLKNTVNDR